MSTLDVECRQWVSRDDICYNLGSLTAPSSIIIFCKEQYVFPAASYLISQILFVSLHNSKFGPQSICNHRMHALQLLHHQLQTTPAFCCTTLPAACASEQPSQWSGLTCTRLSKDHPIDHHYATSFFSSHGKHRLRYFQAMKNTDEMVTCKPIHTACKPHAMSLHLQNAEMSTSHDGAGHK